MGKKKKQEPGNVITRNRKARHDYHVEESFEVGVVLMGTEVKSLREKQISLVDSYARFQGGELWLVNAHINPYSHGTHVNHEPDRPRKLLLHKRELKRLRGKIQEQGLTLIPLTVYLNDGGLVKIELGLCKGKKNYDKRETLRKQDHARDVERARRDSRY